MLRPKDMRYLDSTFIQTSSLRRKSRKYSNKSQIGLGRF